jgi:hypothetical protein
MNNPGELDKEAGMQMAMDFLQTTVPGGGLLGMVKKVKPTKFEKAHEIASKKAESMLGLPSGNTAADRAKALGAVDYYHGTQRLDRLLEKGKINPKRATSGPMPFGTDKTEMASSYAMGKPDTSRIATDEGNVANYFQVTPKSLGYRGTAPYSVEQSWYHLPQDVKQDILNKYRRIGYQNLDEATGPFTLHPEGVEASLSDSHLQYLMQREAKGNPLSALQKMWYEGGDLVDSPETLADIYKLAGYPHEILQTNAPWFEAKGVLTGKAMMKNPLDTSNTDAINELIPKLQQAFKGDRTRLKYGADAWDKNSRYTPKQWVDDLASDIAQGKNSYVWTSIPDKVTEQLKKLGYDGILDTGGKAGGQGHQVVIPFAANQVRSKFAAFDPSRLHEDDLLAGLAPYLGVGGLLGAGAMSQQEESY